MNRKPWFHCFLLLLVASGVVAWAPAFAKHSDSFAWAMKDRYREVSVVEAGQKITYELDGFAFEMESKVCRTRQKAKVSPSPQHAGESQLEKLQLAAIAVAERRHADCSVSGSGRGVDSIELQAAYDYAGRSLMQLFERISTKDGWLFNATQQKRRPLQVAYAKQGMAFVQSVQPMVKSTGHALADRGYLASWLKYKGPKFKLYAATQYPTTNPNLHMVVVHQVSEGQDIVSTTRRDLPNRGESYVVSDGFLQDLQDALDTFNFGWWGRSGVVHYIDGFHHPADDRQAVLAGARLETPIFKQELTLVFEDRPVLLPRRGAIAPRATEYLSTGQPKLGPPRLSIASIRNAFSPEKKSAKPVLAKVTAAAGSQPNVGPSDTYLVAETQKQKRANELGYVYRNDNFWATFRAASVRGMFDGELPDLHINSPVVRVATIRYLEQNSTRCQSSIVDPRAFTITQNTKTYDGMGTLVNDTDRTTGRYLIPGRFAAIYAYYYNIAGSGLSDSEEIRKAFDLVTQRGRSADSRMRTLEIDVRIATDTAVDAVRLSESSSCGSAMHKQFEENLYRLAMGQPTLQAAGLSVAGAADESDEVYVRGAADSLAVACMAEFDFARDQRTLKVCACKAQAIGKHLSPTRAMGFKANYPEYRALLRDIKQFRSRNETHPDEAVYFADGRCRSIGR